MARLSRKSWIDEYGDEYLRQDGHMNAPGHGKHRHTHDHGRGRGPILDGDRAMRARELAEQSEPAAGSQMPDPGQEWSTVLAHLRRRATASTVKESDEVGSAQ